MTGAEAAQQALDRALTEALADADAITQDNLDVITRDHLAPVHAAVVGEARRIGPKVAAVRTPIEVAQADTKVRAAVVQFEELAARYEVIRSVWSRSNMHHETKWQQPALAAIYAEVRNPADVWPDFTRLQHQVRAQALAPWQAVEMSRERLLWLVENSAADVWLPTPAELNALVAQRHADEIGDHANAMMRTRAAKVWGA